MKDRQNKNRKRLRFVPLILGAYGALLGFGLMAIGFAEIGQGIGMLRFLMGLGMAGFGLLGIWDAPPPVSNTQYHTTLSKAMEIEW